MLNYPRAGKTGAARWIPGLRLLLALFALLVAFGALIFAIAWATIEVPEPGDFALAESTEVYYADNATRLGSYSEFNRESVPLDSLPVYVGHSVVASEDRRFYDNNGVDLIGTTRALVNNLQGNPTQGGSTLTQQYVERYYLDTTTSLLGKFQEAILALKINLEQPKNEVLENYLNTIYFGRGAYGIQTAAQAYFNKDAADLTLSESALLAGIIPAPSAWDPAVSPERAEQRWNRVLDTMVQDGWISEQERAAQVLPEVAERSRDNSYAGPNGYILEHVRTELRERAGLTDEEIDRGGFTINTTIVQGLQEDAVNAVAALPEDRPENNHVAMVSVDPRSGAIQMLYGGDDYLTRARNGVTQDRAQAGSTFKPFTMLAALDEGATLDRRYVSNSPMAVEGWPEGSPLRNYNNHSFGQITMLEATRHSVNTYYAQLNNDVGPQATVDAAVAAGIPADTPGLEALPSNVLGPASVRPIDLARAYSTIAASGVRHEPFMVNDVTDREGNVIYTGNTSGEQVFEEQITHDATFAMEQVVRGGSAARLASMGRDIAGKTGTSNDNRSAWFAGYIPQMVTVVAMYESDENGNEVPLSGFGGVSGITGGTYPVSLWRSYMTSAIDTLDLPAEDFPPRSSWQRDTMQRETPLPTRRPTPRPTRTQESTPAPAPTRTQQAPTGEPTQEPTGQPTQEPTGQPTQAPTGEPTQETPGEGGGSELSPPATQPTEEAETQGGGEADGGDAQGSQDGGGPPTRDPEPAQNE